MPLAKGDFNFRRCRFEVKESKRLCRMRWKIADLGRFRVLSAATWTATARSASTLTPVEHFLFSYVVVWSLSPSIGLFERGSFSSSLICSFREVPCGFLNAQDRATMASFRHRRLAHTALVEWTLHVASKGMYGLQKGRICLWTVPLEQGHNQWFWRATTPTIGP